MTTITGGASNRPAILTPSAHSSQQLLDDLLKLSRGDVVGRLSPRTASYMKAQQFVPHRRLRHA